jgi:hypothetical protein
MSAMIFFDQKRRSSFWSMRHLMSGKTVTEPSCLSEAAEEERTTQSSSLSDSMRGRTARSSRVSPRAWATSAFMSRVPVWRMRTRGSIVLSPILPRIVVIQ